MSSSVARPHHRPEGTADAVRRTAAGNRAQSWIEHRELIAAISARDEQRATQVMRAHTEHSRRTCHQHERS
ncbi:FCD domain-containing protein [Streptomyces sp. NPDC006274]|uniref:FCD domain-containing protein n=1 Tax=unclassified Streptomyces TaxID=2593676 RepID=UPI0033A12A4A